MPHHADAVVRYVRIDGQTGELDANQVSSVVWIDEARGRLYAKSGDVIHITDVAQCLASWWRSR
jgi:hypothetical protein